MIFLPLLFLPAVLGKLRRGDLGKVPAMGWNTWNSLNCDKYDKTVLEATANKMIDLGLKVSH
jgi:alpha-galactosidase